MAGDSETARGPSDSDGPYRGRDSAGPADLHTRDTAGERIHGLFSACSAVDYFRNGVYRVPAIQSRAL